MGGTPKEAVADPAEHRINILLRAQELSLVGGGGQGDELRNFMQGIQKENA